MKAGELKGELKAMNEGELMEVMLQFREHFAKQELWVQRYSIELWEEIKEKNPTLDNFQKAEIYCDEWFKDKKKEVEK